MKPKVLIVDDDEAIRTQMKWALSQDYEVHFAEDRKGALEVFKANSPAVTLLDLGLPPHPNQCDEGLAALSELLEVDATAKVIVISGQSEKQNALQAVGEGAYDFLTQARGDGRTETAPSPMHPGGGARERIPRITTEPAFRCF